MNFYVGMVLFLLFLSIATVAGVATFKKNLIEKFYTTVGNNALQLGFLHKYATDSDYCTAPVSAAKVCPMGMTKVQDVDGTFRCCY